MAAPPEPARTGGSGRRGAAVAAVVLTLGLAAGCSTSASSSPAAAPSPVPPSAVPSPSPSPAGPAYVALGDSVAAGLGAADPFVDGYVPVLSRLLSPACGGAAPAACGLQVRNLAVPGATTASLLHDQLPQAVRLLQDGPGVRLVTVTVGGNDVFLPVLQACAEAPETPACAAAVTTAVQQADAGIDAVLRGLADAAAPRTVVAVMTYYDPVPACHLAPLQPLAEQVLEGVDGRPGLNDVLRARAAEHGARVVETAELLSAPDDFVGDADCLHPSGSGHARIAEAFADAVGGSLAAGTAPDQR